jgi:glycosyltransferase involved in cell wall biosynthesis
MSAQPAVSVIVPVYNTSRYLEQCLDSLLSQSLDRIEIIVVDDGSTDESPAICDSYAAKDRRVKVIHKANSGYGATMNRGIAAATGEYIGITESDDFATRNTFAALYKLATKHDAELAKACFYEYQEGRACLFEGLARRLKGQASLPKGRARRLKGLARLLEGRARRFRNFTGFPTRKAINPADHPKLIMGTPSIWAAVYRRDFLARNAIDFRETPGASFQDTSFVHKCWMAANRSVLTNRAYLNYRVDNPDSSVKATTKVFEVNDEFASSLAFLERRPAKFKAFIGAFNAIRFDTYRWNYWRISDEFHYDYVQRIYADMLVEQQRDTLVRVWFSGENWGFLHEILADPETFAAHHPGYF